MRKSWWFLLLIVCLAFAPGAMAIDPVEDDEICDDPEVGDALTCNVTKVVLELDAPVPTGTFFGEFCDDPTSPVSWNSIR